MNQVLYRVQLAAPGAHLFEVELQVSAPDREGQVVSLPAWIRGSYMIRDFARNIIALGAECRGHALAVEKLDKQTWRCPPCSGPLTIRCQIYAWELSVRAAHFDTTHAYFNGTSLFLRVHGQEEAVHEVEIEPPDGDRYAAWRVATSLDPVVVEARGFGRYRAANYEALIDHPVEIGDLAETSFQVAGVPHRFAVYGRHRADLGRLARDLTRVCAQHVGLFGELPLQRYLFLVMAVNEGYGGLEHRSSTSLLCKRGDLPQPGETGISEGYRRFLGLCSHEYFHLWNVKRITPAVFLEQGLEREVHTRLLWAFEGITSYYDDLALVRSGCIDVKAYLELLAQTISRVVRGRGRFKQSLAESSFDAWTRFYKQDENAPNAIVSYYTKGALVALALDLTLRQRSDGRCTLDHVMRELWRRFGKTGRGVPEDGVEQVATQVSGLDLSEFFDRAIRGTDDLPLVTLLEHMGIGLNLRPANNSEDMGGVVDAPGESIPKRTLGLRLQPGAEAVVAQVLDGGAAQAAGVAAGDQLVAADGLRVNAGNLQQLVDLSADDRPLRLHLFRRDELLVLDLTPLPAPADTCELWLVPEESVASRDRRARWLG